MMMSKPSPESSEKKAKAPDAVADLERRLEMLSTAPAAAPPATTETPAAPSFAVPPPAAAEAPAKGKNALLARIMAAQEKAKQTQPKAPPPTDAPAPDLLSMDAPPAFDATALPPQQEQPPPPAFDDSFLAPPPQQQQQQQPPSMMWDPHAAPPAPAAFAPPAASAPDIGDLLSHEAPLPTAVPPPPAAEQQGPGDAIEAILGLEGLSEAEKQELIEEQLKIMDSIEQNATSNKNAAAHNAADAFESRSFSANVQSIGGGSRMRGTRNTGMSLGKGRNAVLHGPERSQQAIADGTAVSVQCISCQSWMQVTAQATLMNCPVCSTVQPITNAHDDAEAAQLAADMELAEKLQQEEYQEQERQEARAASRRPTESAPAVAPASSKDQGWMEWLGLSSASSSDQTGPEHPTSFAQAPVHRGGVGVSRPPGAARLSTPTTGQEGFGSVPSYDSADGIRSSNTARVAQQQPLFSCVTDSISTALTTAMTGPPPEGVDGSSLLAMPQVRREDSR